jgi:transposase
MAAAKKKRRTFSAAFKSKVALEALQERAGITESSKRYDVHVNLILQWKKALEENSHRIFEGSHPGKDERYRQTETLNREKGVLAADADFLKKSWNLICE